MTDSADREQVSRLLREFPVHDGWMDTLDPGSPDWLKTLLRETIDAYKAGDVDWVLKRTHPEVVISQPDSLPDARTYLGRDGMLEAFLDWPREWHDFAVEPTRIFAVGDESYIADGIHSGRSLRMGFEVEVRIIWLFDYEDGLLRRWRMYTDVDRALEDAKG